MTDKVELLHMIFFGPANREAERIGEQTGYDMASYKILLSSNTNEDIKYLQLQPVVKKLKKYKHKCWNMKIPKNILDELNKSYDRGVQRGREKYMIERLVK